MSLINDNFREKFKHYKQRVDPVNLENVIDFDKSTSSLVSVLFITTSNIGVSTILYLIVDYQIELQSERLVNLLESWGTKSGMRFNPDKCNIIISTLLYTF